jgi:hypothetical protein
VSERQDELDAIRELRSMGALRVTLNDKYIQVVFGEVEHEPEQPDRPPAQPTESEFVRDTVKTMLASSEDS